MALYNFKKIMVVPPAKVCFVLPYLWPNTFIAYGILLINQWSSQDFIDIILSKTQRKTPTVVHKQYKISRIRGFYMRKVKFTQANFHERLTQIIQDFPKLDVSFAKAFANLWQNLFSLF
jgi:nucleolar GTP-binding protein